MIKDHFVKKKTCSTKNKCQDSLQVRCCFFCFILFLFFIWVFTLFLPVNTLVVNVWQVVIFKSLHNTELTVVLLLRCCDLHIFRHQCVDAHSGEELLACQKWGGGSHGVHAGVFVQEWVFGAADLQTTSSVSCMKTAATYFYYSSTYHRDPAVKRGQICVSNSSRLNRPECKAAPVKPQWMAHHN